MYWKSKDIHIQVCSEIKWEKSYRAWQKKYMLAQKNSKQIIQWEIGDIWRIMVILLCTRMLRRPVESLEMELGVTPGKR